MRSILNLMSKPHSLICSDCKTLVYCIYNARFIYTSYCTIWPKVFLLSLWFFKNYTNLLINTEINRLLLCNSKFAFETKINVAMPFFNLVCKIQSFEAQLSKAYLYRCHLF